MQVAVKPPMAVTNAVSWRSEGIKYKKNEVFLDVVESVNLLVNSNGTVVRSEVVGALKMRTFLSGMPECKLGLNDKVLCLCSLHELLYAGCTRLALRNPPSVCVKPDIPAMHRMLHMQPALCVLNKLIVDLTCDRCCLRLKGVAARAKL